MFMFIGLKHKQKNIHRVHKNTHMNHMALQAYNQMENSCKSLSLLDYIGNGKNGFLQILSDDLHYLPYLSRTRNVIIRCCH